jgi:hypothetical protein
MNRKEAIYRVGLLLGATVISPQLFFTACQRSNNASDEDGTIKIVNEIAGIIIPKTNSPSAKEANVGPMVITLLKDCYTAEYLQLFTAGLATINQISTQDYGEDFIGLSETDQKFLIGKIDLEERNQKNSDKLHYFKLMKELVLLSYFTSEIGCTEALRYLPVPGKYIGDFPYQKGDKAWATS